MHIKEDWSEDNLKHDRLNNEDMSKRQDMSKRHSLNPRQPTGMHQFC